MKKEEEKDSTASLVGSFIVGLIGLGIGIYFIVTAL